MLSLNLTEQKISELKNSIQNLTREKNVEVKINPMIDHSKFLNIYEKFNYNQNRWDTVKNQTIYIQGSYDGITIEKNFKN